MLCACVQVFYHLGELDDALSYAMNAGTLFQIDEQSEYVQTLIGASLLSCQTLQAYCTHMRPHSGWQPGKAGRAPGGS